MLTVLIEEEKDLKNDLGRTSRITKLKRMMLNSNKTKIMVASRNKNITNRLDCKIKGQIKEVRGMRCK